MSSRVRDIWRTFRSGWEPRAQPARRVQVQTSMPKKYRFRVRPLAEHAQTLAVPPSLLPGFARRSRAGSRELSNDPAENECHSWLLREVLATVITPDYRLQASLLTTGKFVHPNGFGMRRDA